MHKNRFWLGFLCVAIVASLWYTGLAAYLLYDYSQLEKITQATVTQWEVIELKSDKYALQGTYYFTDHGKIFSASSMLKEPVFLNRYAAENEIPKLVKQRWSVWYNAANPNHSTLQKKFPLKECASAVMMITLALYLTFLGFYVGGVRQHGAH